MARDRSPEDPPEDETSVDHGSKTEPEVRTPELYDDDEPTPVYHRTPGRGGGRTTGPLPGPPDRTRPARYGQSVPPKPGSVTPPPGGGSSAEGLPPQQRRAPPPPPPVPSTTPPRGAGPGQEPSRGSRPRSRASTTPPSTPSSSRHGPEGDSPGGELGRRLATLQLQVRSIREALTKQEREIHSTRSMASLADARLGELEEELQTLRDRELVQLTKRVGEVETQLQRTRADRDALRQSLSDHRKQREQLEATLAGIETRFADLEWRISRVSQADSEGSKELASRVAELERGLEQRDARLADLEARLAHAESRSAGPGRSSPSERASPEGTSDDPSSAHSDDLRRIRGIGPRFARALQDHGVHTFAQIAAWTEEDIDTMAERLGIRPQRIRRDGWVQSARKLAEPE